MIRGTYTKGYHLGKLYFKISSPMNNIEKHILASLNKDNTKEYVKEIQDLNINTSKLYYSLSFKNKLLFIQEYISGPTLDEYLHLDIKNYQLDYFIELMNIFKRSLSNPNIKIDWNLNNFIVSNELVLVDYTPILFTKWINELDIKPLKELYLTPSIQLAGIIGYWLKAYIDLNEEDFLNLYKQLLTISNNIVGINLQDSLNIEHLFIKRITLIEQCLNKQISYEQMKKEYCQISLKKQLNNILEEV
ncbi:MAG: hypothetical protein PHD10_04585 [Bacilli bacterium]|nr:hypothetical protein [Bacilli bacterium]